MSDDGLLRRFKIARFNHSHLYPSRCVAGAFAGGFAFPVVAQQKATVDPNLAKQLNPEWRKD
jgi:hypothetical protein